MGSIAWLGVNTGLRYEFMERAIPSALLSPVTQQPLLEATYNGETVIAANHDGSVARTVATGPPPGASPSPLPPGHGNDIYSAYTLASLWEQAAGGASSAPSPGGGGFGMGVFGGMVFG